MRWVSIGLVLLGVLLTYVAVRSTMFVYAVDGLLSWRVPGGVLLTMCALYFTGVHLWDIWAGRSS